MPAGVGISGLESDGGDRFYCGGGSSGKVRAVRRPKRGAGPLKLISSMATRELLGELVSRYQRATGQSVTTEAAGGVDVARRVQMGEAVDIVILASNAIDTLIAEEKLLAGSRVDLVRSGIAIAVRKGTAKPDISTEEAVKSAILAARTLSYSTGPSGVYLEKLFARWGIMDDVRGRIVVAPPGVPVGTLIANGAAEVGFQQLSELLSLSGVEVVGPLPPAIQTVTIFSGGISASCSQPESARALLDYMASPPAADVKQRHGMEAV
jgi:molybdate transport system substrate-binding protein